MRACVLSVITRKSVVFFLKSMNLIVLHCFLFTDKHNGMYVDLKIIILDFWLKVHKIVGFGLLCLVDYC